MSWFAFTKSSASFEAFHTWRRVPVVVALAGLVGGLVLASPAVLADEQRVTIGVDSEVLARRGEDAVTEAEIRARIDEIPEEHRRGFLESPRRFTEMLTNAVLEKALYNEYRRSDEFSDNDTQAQIYIGLVRKLAEIARERYVDEHLLDDYSQRARELYLSDPERYREAGTFTFGQIALIKTRRDDDGQIDALAERLLDQLRDGADFEELALEWSDDPRVERNRGVYRDTAIDELNAQTREVLESMSAGEMKLLDTGRVITLFELVARNEGAIPEFGEVADRLERQARERHRERLMETYLGEKLEGELNIPEGAIREFLEHYDVEWAPPESREAE